MNYYFCVSCKERIELKHDESHFKSQLHLDNEKTVINKYTITNQDISQINDSLINNLKIYNRRFNYYEIVC